MAPRRVGSNLPRFNFACTALGNRVLVRQRSVRCSSRTVLLCLSPTGELCGTAPTARCERTWVGVGVAKVGRGCQKLIFRGFHVV